MDFVEICEVRPVRVGGISSLFFTFADIIDNIIHNIFSVDPKVWTKHNASSYLDLSSLYGTSQENSPQRTQIRRHREATQRFVDARLIYVPPAVCALLVLIRNHNVSTPIFFVALFPHCFRKCMWRRSFLLSANVGPSRIHPSDYAIRVRHILSWSYVIQIGLVRDLIMSSLM
jgi:hypothetical protein